MKRLHDSESYKLKETIDFVSQEPKIIILRQLLISRSWTLPKYSKWNRSKEVLRSNDHRIVIISVVLH